MDIITAAVIGIALAMDAFAVSVSCGSADKTKGYKCAFITAGAFGIFQMLMPIIGWSVGKVGSSVIDGFDHWVSFGVLVFLGAKMILDSRTSNELSGNITNGLKSLIVMSVATSVDALTAGIVLPSAVHAYSTSEMLTAVSVIGIVTFILSLCGYLLGKGIQRINPMFAEIAGGVILIILGIKSLISG